MLSLELEARGTAMDLHSGRFGNIALDPAMDLVDLLASMRGPDGRIVIEGFHDDVREPTPGELGLAAKVPNDADEFARETRPRRAVRDQRARLRARGHVRTDHDHQRDRQWPNRGGRTRRSAHRTSRSDTRGLWSLLRPARNEGAHERGRP